GIEVPDLLWQYNEFRNGKKYSDNQAEHMFENPQLLSQFDQWVTEFRNFVEAKGKVQPGKYRAFGYKAPGHKLADMKLKWRAVRMSAGQAPDESSPKLQNDLKLNKDATFHPKNSASE
ncbi:MAG: hypothetical protein H7235_11780, partial [Bdellovibrionaceae bacterium]|nr:hypothetical protein [Pseudobdellovibrionaceae bacterium]